jgi:predicted TIM-barrel fold metal-dependent hydrolase
MKNQGSFSDIYDLVSTLPVFSDHEHHRTDEFFLSKMTLDRLFQNSYVAWTGYTPNETTESRKKFLDNVRFNSYFIWFEKGLQKVYGIEEPVTVESWEGISQKVEDAYSKDRDFHWKTLKQSGYEKLVQDSYWNPGDDNGHEEILIPTFRIDKFMYGYHPEVIAPDEFMTWERYGFTGGSLDDYVEMMKDIVRKQYKRGKVVALKCAEAYYRTIAFLPDDKESAKKVFGMHPSSVTREQELVFSNYIFNRCCELAAELDIPFQVHTGLARLSGSQPMKLEPVIAKYPDTNFVLFHSGYPWVHEVAGLAHNYRNVFPSLTWTATISTTAAVRALHEFIDTASSINKITWGSDCWVPEESTGALLAWRYIVAKVLSERLNDRLIHANDVEILAKKLMHGNGRGIYLKI